MYLEATLINKILTDLAVLLKEAKEALLQINRLELEAYSGTDTAVYNRLKIDEHKFEAMLQSLYTLAGLENPLGKLLYSHLKENGLQIENRTAPFGTVLIIYESRPDVTIEAAAIAFKSGNKIQLKGGKESHQTNKFLVQLWQKALEQNGAAANWVVYLDLDRNATQEYLQSAAGKIDLVVPRGGEQLIRMVKQFAACAVLVSGRGNNFIYIDANADNTIIGPIIKNAKLSNISACNALDKVLIHQEWLEHNSGYWQNLVADLEASGTTIAEYKTGEPDEVLYEEFLANKMVWMEVPSMENAITTINNYSGKHSASILSTDIVQSEKFLQEVDCAAVYVNASTRFTDGGQFGLGAELAISTDKIHHRGPLGLQHLVTNKWIIRGNGQIRN